MRKYSLLGLIGFLIFFWGSVYADALTVRPAVIDDLELVAGAAEARSVTVINELEYPIELEATLYDLSGSENERGFPKISPRNETSTLSNWITIKDGNIVRLQGRESKTVTLVVAPPKGASAGGHYALLGWKQKGESTIPQSGASIEGVVGTNIAVRVAGDIVEKADIVTFNTANGKTSYDKLPVQFVTRINNSGTVHFKPQGAITVKNMFGSVVTTLPFNVTNGGGNVLPRSTREFTNDWQGEFAFGKYTALLNVDLAGAGVKTASLDLWVMPAGLLVLWLIIALIILVILVLLIRRALLSSPAMKK